MMLHVGVQEGRDIPKMDVIGKCDPYCVLWLSSRATGRRKTQVIKKTYSPVWNEVYSFPVGNQAEEVLQVDLYDWDRSSSDDKISTLKIQLATLKVGKVTDAWYDMVPVKGVKKGGQVKLKLHLAPAEVPAFAKAAPGSAPGVAPVPIPPQPQPATHHVGPATLHQMGPAPDYSSYAPTPPVASAFVAPPQPAYYQPPQQPVYQTALPQQPKPSYYQPPPQPGYYQTPPPQPGYYQTPPPQPGYYQTPPPMPNQYQGPPGHYPQMMQNPMYQAQFPRT